MYLCALDINTYNNAKKVSANQGLGGSGDLFEMKICPSVNFATTQQMKCKHFFVFAVPKFACLWKNRKSFCGMKNNVYFCIEYGKELIYHQRLQRIAERVAKGGHNIPEPIARRRYVAGINNLFNLFMSEVDYWDVYDNSEYPRKQIACGGKDAGTVICNELLFAKIQNYVR